MAVWDGEQNELISRIVATVAEGAADAIVAVDGEGVIVYANPALAAMVGRRLDDLLGSPSELLLPERDREHQRRRLVDLLASGDPDSTGRVAELTVRRADGSEFPVEVSRGVWTAGEAPIVAGVLRDISERKRSESAHRRLAAIIAASPDAVIGLAPDGTIESWNRGAEVLFGRDAEEVVGAPLTTLAPADSVPDPHLLAAVRAGERVRAEVPAVSRDGTAFTVEATVAPMRDSTGALIGFSCIARDVTDRKRDEHELQRLAQAASIGYAQAIVSIDFDGVVHHWNAGAERLYGWSAEEALGRPLDELTIDASELRDGLARVLAGGLSEPREFRRRRRDGSFVDVLLWGGVWRQDGVPAGMTSVAVDIGRRRARERDAERRVAELERIQRIAQLGSWRWNPRVDEMWWSAEMFEIYARDPNRGPASGAESLAYVHPGDRQRIAGRLAETFGGRTVWRAVHRLIDERGETKRVLVQGYADPERPGCYYGTLLDITGLPSD